MSVQAASITLALPPVAIQVPHNPIQSTHQTHAFSAPKPGRHASRLDSLMQLRQSSAFIVWKSGDLWQSRPAAIQFGKQASDVQAGDLLTPQHRCSTLVPMQLGCSLCQPHSTAAVQYDSALHNTPHQKDSQACHASLAAGLCICPATACTSSCCPAKKTSSSTTGRSARHECCCRWSHA